MYSDDQAGYDSGTPRRILGMKIWQAAILLGMAAMDCLVVIVGGAVVIGPLLAGLPSPQAEAPASGLTPISTQTPLTMVFQFPTYTPYGTPYVTPTPEDWMTGWTQFTVTEAEMWMPESYAAGDPHTEAEAILASLEQKGAVYNWEFLLEEMTKVDENFIFWGLDSYQGNPEFVTNVMVIYADRLRGESIPEYVARDVSGDFNLLEEDPFPHPLYEAERLILDSTDPNDASIRYVLYVVGGDHFFWNILCVTAKDELADREPDFDKMAGTFRVLADPK